MGQDQEAFQIMTLCEHKVPTDYKACEICEPVERPMPTQQQIRTAMIDKALEFIEERCPNYRDNRAVAEICADFAIYLRQ